MVVPPALAAAAYAASLIIACIVGFQKTATEAPPLAQRLVIAPGVSMPLLANGISRNHSVWLASGGRHIDTAFWYGDVQQAAVGEAIAASGVPRGELFITTKVACCPTERCSSFCDAPPNPVGASTTNVTEQLEHSLGLLGLQQADLVLLHNPCSRPSAPAATLGLPGCNPRPPRLQPHASQAVTVCRPDQPHASQARGHSHRLRRP